MSEFFNFFFNIKKTSCVYLDVTGIFTEKSTNTLLNTLVRWRALKDHLQCRHTVTFHGQGWLA